MKAGIPRPALVAAVALALIACAGARNSLGDLAPVSQIVVQQTHGKSAAIVVTDRAVIDSVVHFVAASRGWNDVWDTPPSGEWSVALMRDTTLVAVLWLGPQFAMTRGYQPPGRFESVHPSAAQSASLRLWLGIPQG